MKRLFCSIITILTLGYGPSVLAQTELSLNFMNDVWQSNLTNPAMLNDKKINILLPSVYFNLNSPDAKVNDWVYTEPQTGRRILLDSLVLASFNGGQNRFNAHINAQTLGIAVPVSKRLTLSLFHAVNVDPSVSISGDLATVFVRGNTGYVGKTAYLGSTLDMSVRSELGLGAVYKLANLTVGARVKLLSGAAGVFTPKDKFNVTFDNDNLQLKFDTDMQIVTFGESDLRRISNPQDLLKNSLFSQNSGFAFDLGATVKIGKMRLAASLIDLGGTINWKKDAKTYQSSGNYTYSGVNARDFYNFDAYQNRNFEDTLKRVIGFTETEGGTYTQKLPLRTYLSGTFDLSDALRVGALLYSETQSGTFNGALALNASYAVKKWLRVGATYAVRNGTFDNLGAQLTAKIGFIQVYALTDNLLTVFRPYDAHNANGRVGMNVVF